jgi:hypothetical protein
VPLRSVPRQAGPAQKLRSTRSPQIQYCQVPAVLAKCSVVAFRSFDSVWGPLNLVKSTGPERRFKLGESVHNEKPPGLIQPPADSSRALIPGQTSKSLDFRRLRLISRPMSDGWFALRKPRPTTSVLCAISGEFPKCRRPYLLLGERVQPCHLRTE